MASLSVLLLVAGVAPGSARGESERGHGFLSMHMQPEVVATSLGKVEDEWKNEYRLFIECNRTATTKREAERCLNAPKEFERSCGKIVSAMLQASSGDREAVHEYMADVCTEPELKGWRQGRCEILAATVLAGMTPDSYMNRERLDTVPVCQNFWSRFATEEAMLMQQEMEEQLAKQKELEERREASAKEAAAEEERYREEEAKAKQMADEAAAEERRKEEAERREAEEAASKLSAQHGEDVTATAQQATHLLADEATANATAQQATTNATAQQATETAVNATAQDQTIAESATSEATTNATTQQATETAVNATTQDQINAENATSQVATNSSPPVMQIVAGKLADNATGRQTTETAVNATTQDQTANNAASEANTETNATGQSTTACSAVTSAPTTNLVENIPNMVYAESVNFCGAGQLKIVEGACEHGDAFDAAAGVLKSNAAASSCQRVACAKTPCCMAFRSGASGAAWAR